MKVIEASEKNLVIEALKKCSFVPHNIIGVMENTEDPIKFDQVTATVWVTHGYFNYVYGSCEKVLEHFNTLEKGFYGFAAVHGALAQAIRKGQFLHWFEPTERYIFNGDYQELTEKLKECPYELKSIPMCEAEGIDNRYEYKDDTTYASIQDAIENRPSSGVYLDGKLVSYALVHEDDSIGFMYTLEEYRHLGIGYWVTLDITKKMIQRGRLPFVEITEKNFKSQGLAKKTGYEKDAFTPWFGIVKGIPDWFNSYSPYGKEGYIFTSLAHLRVVNLMADRVERSITFQKDGNGYTGYFDADDSNCFSLKEDDTGEAFVLVLNSGLKETLMTIVQGVVADLPERNASLILPYDEALREVVGGFWVDAQRNITFVEGHF